MEFVINLNSPQFGTPRSNLLVSWCFIECKLSHFIIQKMYENVLEIWVLGMSWHLLGRANILEYLH